MREESTMWQTRHRNASMPAKLHESQGCASDAPYQRLSDGPGLPPPVTSVGWTRRQSIDDSPSRGKSLPEIHADGDRVRKCLEGCLPVVSWIRKYDMTSLRLDMIGGVTIGTICLAQTLAHAVIATTRDIQGPYTAFMPTVVYAFFGTSPHASVSSGAIAAILIADQVQPWASLEDRTEVASLLSMLVGAILMVMGLCKASFAVRFLSQPTLSGFISGGAILIMTGQLKNFFGFRDFPHTSGVYDTLKTVFEEIHTMDPVTFGLACLFIVFLDMVGRVRKRALAALKKDKACGWALKVKRISELKEIMVATAGVTIGYLTRGADGEPTILTVGHIPAGLPPLKPPWHIGPFQELMNDKSLLYNFVMGGVLVAMCSYLTTYATIKKMALKNGNTIDPSQELIALGAAGFIGSFFGCFPPSGSLSRTGLASELGIRTQAGGLFAAAVVGIGLVVLAPTLLYLPKAVIAAIIMKSSTSLVDFEMPADLWKYCRLPKTEGGFKRDFRIWVIAFTVTLLFGVIYGIAAAVIMDLGLIVKDASTPRVAVLGRLDGMGGRKWRNIAISEEAKMYEGIMIFEFRGPLSFASADHFCAEVERQRREQNETQLRLFKRHVEIVILSFASVHYLDASAVQMLTDLLAEWKSKHIGCLISGAKHKVRVAIEQRLQYNKAGQKMLDQTDFMMSIGDAVHIARRRLNHTDATSPRGQHLPCQDARSVKRAMKQSAWETLDRSQSKDVASLDLAKQHSRMSDLSRRQSGDCSTRLLESLEDSSPLDDNARPFTPVQSRDMELGRERSSSSPDLLNALLSAQKSVGASGGFSSS